MRKFIRIIAILCLLIGISFMLYNPISGWISNQKIESQISEFEHNLAINDISIESEQSEANEVMPYKDLYEDMQAYNKEIYENGQSGLVDAWSYEQPIFDLSSYGLETDVIGVLDIPVMEVSLPVYLGASRENMAKGVAVLGQTSMPIGGENTNSVIAGHRGYYGALMFREIEKLQPGDLVYLTTFWGKKTYEVQSSIIILPEEVDSVLIQEGKEMLTLISCEPYVEATHRYVVYCTAVEDEQLEEPVNHSETDTSTNIESQQNEISTSEKRIKFEQMISALSIPLVMVAVIIMIWTIKKKKH